MTSREKVLKVYPDAARLPWGEYQQSAILNNFENGTGGDVLGHGFDEQAAWDDAASKLPPGSPAGETASEQRVMETELCECGHLKAWHSLMSDRYLPAASGCLAECTEGGSKCPCKAFRPVAVPEPVPTEGELKVRKMQGRSVPLDSICLCQKNFCPIHSTRQPSAPEAAAASGFICAKYKIVEQGPYINLETRERQRYVYRCDLPEGHEGDHVDSVLLVNWPQVPAAPIAPAAEELIWELVRGLSEAAQSLHTLAEQSGREEELKHMDQVRGYANSRANAADEALESYRKGAKNG